MYFNRPIVKMEVKRSMRQTRPHPMLVTLLYLVISGAGAWLISWLMNTLFPSRIDLDSLRYYLLIGNNHYGSQLFSWIVQTALVSLVVSILTTAWSGLMNTGYSGYCLNMSRDMNPPLERIFSGFSRAGTVILTYILVAVFTFLWTLLFTVGLILLFVMAALLVKTSSAMAALGVLLFLASLIFYAAAIIWVSYRYAMVPFILADSQGPVAALDIIRASKNMMQGRKGSFFVLRISFIGWYLLEYLIVFIGFIIMLSVTFSSISWYFRDFEDLMRLLYMLSSGSFDILTELLIPVTIISIVCGAAIFIINLWLTPYRTGCEAHFYLYALGGGQSGPYGGQPGPYGGQSGPYGGQSGPYGGQFGQYNSQTGQYGGQSGPYGGQSGPYGGQSGQYSGQSSPYGSQSSPYGSQSSPYGSQSGPYGSQTGQYGGQPGQYSGQAGQYGSQSSPYGSQTGQYGGQPGPYSGQTGQYNNSPYSYQPPSQSTSGGYTQEARPPQYGAAQWGAPQVPQAPQVPAAPAAPEAPVIPESPEFPETVIASVFDQTPAAPAASEAPVTPESPEFPETVIASVFDQAPAAPDDAPAAPDDAPYEAPYAESETPNDDDDKPQTPNGPSYSQY